MSIESLTLPNIETISISREFVQDAGLYSQLETLDVFTDKHEHVVWLVQNEDDDFNLTDTFHSHNLSVKPIAEDLYLVQYVDFEPMGKHAVANGSFGTKLLVNSQNKTFSVLKVGNERLQLQNQVGKTTPNDFTQLLQTDLHLNQHVTKVCGTPQEISAGVKSWINEFKSTHTNRDQI
jgi:hypothetical protein